MRGHISRGFVGGRRSFAYFGNLRPTWLTVNEIVKDLHESRVIPSNSSPEALLCRLILATFADLVLQVPCRISARRSKRQPRCFGRCDLFHLVPVSRLIAANHLHRSARARQNHPFVAVVHADHLAH